MKKDKIVYWVSVSAIFLLISLPALLFNSEMARMTMAHYGFPHYFGVELGLAKFLGGLVLILPMIPRRYKEWAYVGYGFDFIFAFLSGWIVDGFNGMLALPVVALIILALSYKYWHTLNPVS